MEQHMGNCGCYNALRLLRSFTCCCVITPKTALSTPAMLWKCPPTPGCFHLNHELCLLIGVSQSKVWVSLKLFRKGWHLARRRRKEQQKWSLGQLICRIWSSDLSKGWNSLMHKWSPFQLTLSTQHRSHTSRVVRQRLLFLVFFFCWPWKTAAL